MAGDDSYLLPNRRPGTGRRLAALAQVFDPVSQRLAREVGLTEGWRVWEVGAGGPSLPAWFSAQVGEQGRVLATDVDTSWLVGGTSGFEVLEHDVAAEPAPAGGFDLVHARLVLVHLPRRDQALAAMVGALRPGGWLIVEDADPSLQPLACPDEHGPAERLANRLKDAFRTLMAERHADLAFGRTLPARLRAAGLYQVRAMGHFPFGGAACNMLERTTVEQVRQQLVDRGLATEDEVECHLAAVDRGALVLTTAPMISAVGRRPPAVAPAGGAAVERDRSGRPGPSCRSGR